MYTYSISKSPFMVVIMYIEIKNIFMLVKIFVCCIFIGTKYVYYRNTDPKTGYTVLHVDVKAKNLKRDGL